MADQMLCMELVYSIAQLVFESRSKLSKYNFSSDGLKSMMGRRSTSDLEVDPGELEKACCIKPD